MKIRYTDKFKKFAPLRVGELDDLADEMALEIIRKGYAVKFSDDALDEEIDATDVSLEINTAPLEANRKIVEREVKRGRKAKK